jgi:hypothetical protein
MDIDKVKRYGDDETDEHIGRKVTFGVTGMVLLTAAVIIIGGILAIWVF